MAEIISDEQLLIKVQNGDETAENELIDRYKNLATKISRGYFIVGGDYEDTIQEGMIGLYKAIKNYAPEKYASFKTFAIMCIKHQIQTAIKKANTNKNKPLSSAVSLQSFSANNTHETTDYLPVELIFSTTPAEDAIEKENYQQLKAIIKDNLSQLERKVLKDYLQGYSYKEIATRLQISSKSIDNCLSRIKSKLKAKLSA